MARRLTDRQCASVARGMREFGYSDVTAEMIRDLSDKLVDGRIVDPETTRGDSNAPMPEGGIVTMLLASQMHEAELLP